MQGKLEEGVTRSVGEWQESDKERKKDSTEAEGKEGKKEKSRGKAGDA